MTLCERNSTMMKIGAFGPASLFHEAYVVMSFGRTLKENIKKGLVKGFDLELDLRKDIALRVYSKMVMKWSTK